MIRVAACKEEPVEGDFFGCEKVAKAGDSAEADIDQCMPRDAVAFSSLPIIDTEVFATWSLLVQLLQPQPSSSLKKA